MAAFAVMIMFQTIVVIAQNHSIHFGGKLVEQVDFSLLGIILFICSIGVFCREQDQELEKLFRSS